MLEQMAYRTAVIEATDLAGMGEVAAGYDRLRNGLRRAQELRDGGTAWAPGLVEQYAQALERYSARYA